MARPPVVSVREISRDGAERLILKYLQENRDFHYPSDIAKSLRLDPELVFEITESLFREQVIETAGKNEGIHGGLTSNR